MRCKALLLGAKPAGHSFVKQPWLQESLQAGGAQRTQPSAPLKQLSILSDHHN